MNLLPLENLILPGGGVVAAQIHVARTTCRRAERRVVGLSDLLFTISLVACCLETAANEIYTRPDKEPV